jgi:hypothetical protein
VAETAKHTHTHTQTQTHTHTHTYKDYKNEKKISKIAFRRNVREC